MNLPHVFERYRGELEAELQAAFVDRSPSLYDMMRYHLGWIDEDGREQEGIGGKRLRPTLCLLCCEALGGDWHNALPAAAAVELIHNFSLVHDDIVDESPMRHHRPTVWKLWGAAQALNTGDGLHALARLEVFRLEERGIAREKILHAARLLDETCLSLCEGQHLDLLYEGQMEVSVESYLEMIGRKTAALLSVSTALGALMASDSEDDFIAMSGFGRYLGLAFQIQDDILGIWGDEGKTGKPSAGDITSRKKTLPVVHALQHATGKEKERLHFLYASSAESEMPVDEVLELLEKSGSLQYSQEMADKYHQRAKKELDDLTLPAWARDTLEDLANFLVQRQF
jgi:geranylgeranyl diphosphate synthase type I